MGTTSPDAAGGHPADEAPTAQPVAPEPARTGSERTSAGDVPLRRSTGDKVVAGVAGGLGRYLGVDPVIIRVAFVVLALTGGAGVLLYLVGWIAIPEERPGEIPSDAARREGPSGSVLLGGVLIIAGAMLLADRLFPAFSTFVGPLILVAVGIALITRVRR